MHTWHIHIQGQVQGVGFRPFVYKLAKEYGLRGWVNNALDGVHIEFNASRGLARVFAREVKERAPSLSRVTGFQLTMAGHIEYVAFEILHSKLAGPANLLLTPDFAACDECRAECGDAGNRRYNYPFITCTKCGPRFSIVRKLPYDRHTTTMDAFQMCAACQDEYNSPPDRRYYSQTNSCPDCAVRLQFYNGGDRDEMTQPQEIASRIAALWKEGKIVAIKGIGGYLLTCDPSGPVIQELRKRKHRPSKPLALMYPSLDILRADAIVSDEEAAELNNPAAPILLLDIQPPARLDMQAIAPGLNRIGAMLPYTPLFDLLLKAYGKPVIATSGNVSNSPVIYRDEAALQDLAHIADHVLANDREIVIPQDDSVVRYSSRHKKRIVIRRSRGLAPTFIHPGLKFPGETIFAAGAMLKSTFTFLNRGNCYISQYLGDSDSFDTQEEYRHMRDHFFSIFGEMPGVVLADKHPQYFATMEAQRLAAEHGLPFVQFQHHIAHFAAVLGENDLLHSSEPVLGVVWDGTGYGDDGNIWGGEFFIYSDLAFSRCGHFQYFPSILGDKMAMEPRISLLAAGAGSEDIRSLARSKFTDEEWAVYSKMIDRSPGLMTSSVGRLFDAAACLLGLGDVSTYEGEAAGILENLASASYGGEIRRDFSSYKTEISLDGTIAPRPLLDGMLKDLNSGQSREDVALKFHNSLVDIIAGMASLKNVRSLSFSGGVFQNSLLTDLILDRLSGDYELYFHKELSPNDESISFGQLMCYCIQKLRGDN